VARVLSTAAERQPKRQKLRRSAMNLTIRPHPAPVRLRGCPLILPDQILPALTVKVRVKDRVKN